MLSVNGYTRLFRRRWAGGSEGSDYPIDRLIDQAEATLSVGVRELACREGGNARSFARGRENLQRAAKIELGEDLFRRIVESEGQAVLKVSASEQLELDWSASDCKVQTPQGQETTRLYASADGVLVPTITQAEKDKRRQKVRQRRKKMSAKQRQKLKRLGLVKKGTDQRYKQVYVTAFYDQDQAHRLVGVTREKVQGLKRLLRHEAARVHLRAAAERIGSVDGAVCLRNNLENLPLEVILLDFYHLSEHVVEAVDATLGTDKGQTWREEVLQTVRHEGYEPFFQKLLDWRGGLRGQKRKAADKLIGYVASRAEMILYQQCDPRGWNVGSGPMESMCGVTTDRLKGHGRRWDLDNAEAMMALEALYQSTGLWDKYWCQALNHLN